MKQLKDALKQKVDKRANILTIGIMRQMMIKIFTRNWILEIDKYVILILLQVLVTSICQNT